MGLFSKFSCGCVGIVQPGDRAIILIACDEDRDAPRDSLSWRSRDVIAKTATPLDAVAEDTLHARLARQLAKADRYDAIRHALDWPEATE